MKTVICILALALSVKAGLLPHHADEITHLSDGPHHHGHHFADTSSIVVDVADHRDIHHGGAAIVDHHAVDVHHQPAAKIVHHQEIHQVEPVHHVTKVVHHEPHHILHYTKPVVDHHLVRNEVHHDVHHDFHRDFHHDVHHDRIVHPSAAIVHHSAAPIFDHHHHHSAALVHSVPAPVLHHHHAAIVHKDFHPIIRTHSHSHSHLDLLSAAKNHLAGKLRIIEKHF